VEVGTKLGKKWGERRVNSDRNAKKKIRGGPKRKPPKFVDHRGGPARSQTPLGESMKRVWTLLRLQKRRG